MGTGGLNFTGWRRGNVEVVKIANSAPRTWLIKCHTCRSEWTLPDSKVRAHVLSGGGTGAAIPCQLTECRLGRWQPTKITGYERNYLNAPDTVRLIETQDPVKATPVQAEKVSTDYLRYVAVCRKTGQSDVRSWAEFKSFGDFLHKNVMEQVKRLEERHGD